MKSGLKPYGTVFLLLLVSYFPIAFFIAGVKNDILTGYLPVRFFMSESLSAGYMPWWNPYVNFGIPQYADMSSSFWSPVTWLIAGTAGYNIYSITIELLIYILLGAWGMYKCGELFNWNKDVKLIAAITYMCCGYMVAHLQHLNWIAGAGFLPWCFWSYHLLLNHFSFKRLSVAAVWFYLLISASHPGLIIGSIYFFVAYSIYLYVANKESGNQKVRLFHFSKSIFLLVALLLIVCSALIISYTELLPFITRSEKAVSITRAMNSTTFQSWLSFMLPLSTAKNDLFFGNDISLRNNYIGITLLVFLFTLTPGKNRLSFFFLLTGLSFLVLSSNNFIYAFCLKYIPLLSYVRLNGEFRIFALFSLIISAAGNLQAYQAGNVNRTWLKNILIISGVFFFAVIAWAGVKIFLTKESILFSTVSFNRFSLITFFKPIADKLSFYDALILQGLIQLLFVLLIGKFSLLKKTKPLLLVVMADLCLATLFNLPYTGAGTKSPKELQALLNTSPGGIPVPELKPPALNNPGAAGIKAVLGSWTFYNKQPGTIVQAAYPIEFKNEKEIFQKQIADLKNKPFLFFSPDETAENIHLKKVTDAAGFVSATDNKIELLAFSPTHIRAKLSVNQPGDIILLYQNYPHWKYSLNGQPVKAEPYLNAFIKINIAKPGVFLADFSFKPAEIKAWMIVSVTAFVLLLIAAAFLPAKNNSLL